MNCVALHCVCMNCVALHCVYELCCVALQCVVSRCVAFAAVFRVDAPLFSPSLARSLAVFPLAGGGTRRGDGLGENAVPEQDADVPGPGAVQARVSEGGGWQGEGSANE